MNQGTSIEWTHRPGTKGETWNPVTGCNKVSAGCKHCYAEKMHKRLTAMGVKGYEKPFLDGAVPQPHRLQDPFKWKKPRTVFVNSMSDLFHEAVPFDFIDQVFAVMLLNPEHTFLVLTKRPERMAKYLSVGETCIRISIRHAIEELGYKDIGAVPKALPNVWLGTSVEDQQTANERIPHLLKCPAAVRFLSCEPLLGPVKTGVVYSGNWDNPYPSALGNGIDWVIAGGESGAGARPMHPEWVRSLRDQCKAAGAPFFFKQWGAWKAGSTILRGRFHGVHVTMLSSGEYAEDFSSDIQNLMDKYSSDEWQRLDPNIMSKVGKKAAGRLLDGVEHNAWPPYVFDDYGSSAAWGVTAPQQTNENVQLK